MQFTEHDNTITITVSVSAEALTNESLQRALHAAGFERCFPLQTQIDNLLVEYQQLQQKVAALTLTPHTKTLQYAIAERRDAVLNFDVSDDKMTATALIMSAWGGAPISANTLVKAAQDAGIVFGFNKDAIIRLVQQASRGEPGLRYKADIATGRIVKHGMNSRFMPLVADMVIRRNQPLVDSEAKADLRDFGVIPSVAQGTALMQRIPPTAGEAGIAVTGERTEPIPGVALEWQLGSGVQLAEDDPDVLLASQDGLPRAIENGATVDDVFTVSQVDLTSGHIIFKGSVVINGSVAAGMKVLAGGNVFVKGVVEGQLIEAGGDIIIGGAIIGHQLNGGQNECSTVLNAEGDIHCQMAQYSALRCQGNLYVSKYLMHCVVNANSALVGTADKLDGKVVGGQYTLATHLGCGQLGSPSSGAVLIKLNRQLDPITQQQALLRVQIAEAKVLLEETKEQVERQRKMAKGQPDAQLQMLEQEFHQQQRLAKALIAEFRALEDQRQQLLLSLDVKVTRQLFSAVEVQFGLETVRSRREYGASVVKMVAGHPAIEPL